MLPPALLLAVAVLPAGALRPPEKTDVVVLANGNEILGEIKSLKQGRLEFKTDSAGTLSIEWDEILKLTSPLRFRFHTSEGGQLVGTLLPPPKDRVLVIQAEDGQRHELEMVQIIRIWEFDEKVWDRVDGYLQASFSFTKASDVAQWGFGAGLSYAGRRYAVDVDSTLIVTDQKDEDTARKADLMAIYRHFYGSRWFGLGAGLLNHNSELGLDLRTTAAVGPGRFLVQSQIQELSVFAGPAVSHEIPDGESSNTELEGLVGSQYEIFISDTPETSLNLTVVVFPGITESDRVRASVDIDFSKEIVEDFFWTLTYYLDYDNDPSSDDGATTDYGITAGLSYTF